MKALFILLCSLGILLTGMGVNRVKSAKFRAAQKTHLPVGFNIRGGAAQTFTDSNAQSFAIPASSLPFLLFGYLGQILGCGVFAHMHRRSLVWGLLGLLSPIGYIFLACLPREPDDNPV